jgi:hypothetical protein
MDTGPVDRLGGPRVGTVRSISCCNSDCPTYWPPARRCLQEQLSQARIIVESHRPSVERLWLDPTDRGHLISARLKVS